MHSRQDCIYPITKPEAPWAQQCIDIRWEVHGIPVLDQCFSNRDEISWKLYQRWDKSYLISYSKIGQKSFIFKLRKISERFSLEVHTGGPRISTEVNEGVRTQHLPLQACSSLSSEQSRKPSQRSESRMQVSLSSHLNSLLIQVKVLCVAETQRRGHVVLKVYHVWEKWFAFYELISFCFIICLWNDERWLHVGTVILFIGICLHDKQESWKNLTN